jgi:hypothetical protein
MRRYVVQILFTVIVGTLAYGFFEITGNSITEQQRTTGATGTTSGEVSGMGDWIVSGAGDSSYNGIYSDAGVHNGQTYYEIEGGGRYLYWDGSSWVLNSLVSDDTAWYLGATLVPPAVWEADIGDEPAPSVTEYVAPPEEEFIPPTIAITSPLRSELSTAPPWVAGTVDLVCSTVDWGEEDPGLITDDAIEQVTWYTTNHGSPADSVPVLPSETVLSQGGTELLATTLDTTQFTPGSYVHIKIRVEYDDTTEGYPAWAPSIVEAETAILVGNPTIAEPLT